MANKVVATEAAVFAAADALSAQGIEPTYEGILELIKGGSNSTIKPHLIKWKKMSTSVATPVPESVLARAKFLAEAIWGIAVNESQAMFDRAKQLTDAELDRSKEALASSIEISEQHEAQCNALKLQLEAARSDLMEARVKLRQVDELKLELAQAREQVEKHRLNCESLNREVATLSSPFQKFAHVFFKRPASRAGSAPIDHACVRPVH
jgi:Plasmid replication region DNA-binding N-term